MNITPRDFYPPRDDMSHTPPASTDPLAFFAHGWVPLNIEVSDDSHDRFVTLDMDRSVGSQLEEAGYDVHEIEEIRDEITVWFSPVRVTVKLFRETPPADGEGDPTVEFFELHEVVDLVADVLEKQNRPPFIFRRMGTLVKKDYDENDQPTFKELNSAGLQTELSRMARWIESKPTRGGGMHEVTVDPPAKETGIVLRDPPHRVPVIVGLVQTPVLRPDGSLLFVEGFDESTRLMYARPSGMNPTPYESTDAALTAIREMVQDFPFDGVLPPDDARFSTPSFANYLAWLLTPALRPIIGVVPTPVALFSAPTRGTGKDLLAGTANFIYYGTAPAERPLPENDENEIRKELVSAMISGRPLLLYSNVSGVLRSDALAGFVTSSHWSGRRLGHSEDLSFANEMVIGITANNLALGTDWPRRIYRIQLDPRRADPENRPVAIPDLPSWVIAHRNEMLGAVLSLARLWARDTGCRVDPVQWSSYSRWASVVGSVLKHAGVDGFLANTESVATDPSEELWSDLIGKWFDVHASAWVTTAQLEGLSAVPNFWPTELLTSTGDLPENLAQRLGTHLQARKDSMTPDGIRVERHPTANRPGRWRVVR